MIVLTHCGKFGDFLYSLPIGSWLHKTTGEKIHWVLPEMFGPFRYITKLLEYQDITGQVSLVPYKVENYGCGGQPYKFDPAKFGIEGKYYNLGLRHYPNCFITEFMAQEYRLGWDKDFVLQTQPVMPEPGLEVRTEQLQGDVWNVAPNAKTFIVPSDLYDIAVFMKSGSIRHCWFSGVAVMCYFMRVPQIVYGNPPKHLRDMFLPQPNLVTWASR